MTEQGRSVPEAAAEDAAIAALPRAFVSLRQRVAERVLGYALCDQCHCRRATCTVPISDVATGGPFRSVSYPWKRKEFWCPACRARVFRHGQEYAWANDRGQF